MTRAEYEKNVGKFCAVNGSGDLMMDRAQRKHIGHHVLLKRLTKAGLALCVGADGSEVALPLRNLDPPPWLEPAVVETAREAIYAYAHLEVPGGVYEPFLKHPSWTEAGISMLVCAGKVRAHCDSEELPPHAYFAVIVNDGWIAKMQYSKLWDLPPQLPGSFFGLYIHEEHHLVKDPRVKADLAADSGVYGFAALVMNLYEDITEEETAERFRQAFAQVEDQFRDGVPSFYRKIGSSYP